MCVYIGGLRYGQILPKGDVFLIIIKLSTKLTKEERETHYYTDDITNQVEVDTTIMKDFRKLIKQNWLMTHKYINPDGTDAGGRFTAPRRSLSIRSTEKKKLSPKKLFLRMTKFIYMVMIQTKKIQLF